MKYVALVGFVFEAPDEFGADDATELMETLSSLIDGAYNSDELEEFESDTAH